MKLQNNWKVIQLNKYHINVSMYVPIFFKIIILGKDVPLEDLSGEVRNGLTNNDDTTVITISESSNGKYFLLRH